MTDKKRPNFNVNGRSYVSSGVLFFTEDKEGNIYFMLQKITGHSWIYEDFGGKSSEEDTSIKDVAFRECCEELNNEAGITMDFLRSKKAIEYLIPQSKYVLYLIELPYSFKETVDMSVFGDKEILCEVPRTVTWLSYRDLMNCYDNEIHPRLIPRDFKSWLPILLSKHIFGQR